MPTVLPIIFMLYSNICRKLGNQNKQKPKQQVSKHKDALGAEHSSCTVLSPPPKKKQKNLVYGCRPYAFYTDPFKKKKNLILKKDKKMEVDDIRDTNSSPTLKGRSLT